MEGNAGGNPEDWFPNQSIYEKVENVEEAYVLVDTNKKNTIAGILKMRNGEYHQVTVYKVADMNENVYTKGSDDRYVDLNELDEKIDLEKVYQQDFNEYYNERNAKLQQGSEIGE